MAKAKRDKKKVAVKRTPRVRMASNNPLADPRVAAWDMLLRDPCSGNLAYPCYAGTDTGYLVRTTDSFTPGIAGGTFTVGQKILMDGVFQYTPFNISATTGVVGAAAQAGGSLATLTASGFSGNFVATTTVARYRPVAACVKWCATGPYADRAGMVAYGYLPGMVLTAGAFSGNIATLTNGLQMQSPNGTQPQEVRWLPTAVDENFTNTAAAVNTGAGTIMFAFRNMDATANTTTTALLNGFFQITVVWEWVPTSLEGIAVAPRSPLPYTSQQVLGTIKDLGAYIYHGVRSASEIASGVAGGMRLLTGGYREIQRRGVGMPLIQY